MIKGLIFDFDGLILDTESPIYEAWQEVYQEYHAVLPINSWASWLGSSPEAFDPATYLQDQVGSLTQIQEIVIRCQERANERIATQTLLPGVNQLLDEGLAAGLKLAIASSSPADWVFSHLSRYGLTKYFQAILTSENVSRVKPAPDLFLAALRALSIDAHEAIVFEDSPNGILAARRAGIFVIAVPNSVTSLLDLSLADYMTPSLQILSLENILAMVNADIQPSGN